MVSQGEHGHAPVRFALLLDILAHLQPAVRLVPERRVRRVQHESGDGAAGGKELRPIGIVSGAQLKGGCGFSRLLRSRKRSNLLPLAVFLENEVFRLQICYRLAFLIGHHHLHQHHTCIGADGRGGNLGY